MLLIFRSSALGTRRRDKRSMTCVHAESFWLWSSVSLGLHIFLWIPVLLDWHGVVLLPPIQGFWSDPKCHLFQGSRFLLLHPSPILLQDINPSWIPRRWR